MQKRGNIEPSHYVILVLFDAFIISMVFLGLWQYVKSIEQDTLFEKSYLSKDLALLVDTIYAAPGDVSYVYTHHKVALPEFIFSFGDSQATVAEIFKTERNQPAKGAPIYYPYAEDSNVQTQPYTIESPSSLVFRLSGNSFVVNPNSVQGAFECPDIKTSAKRIERVVVDPGKGIDPSFGSGTYTQGAGAVNQENPKMREQDITKRIANSLLTLMVGQQFPKVEKTRQEDEFVSIADRRDIVSDADLLISLHAGNQLRQEYDTVVAYVYAGSSNRIRSMKLACLINKQLASTFDVESTSIRMLSATDLEEDNPLKVVQRDEVSIALEIGNIQHSTGMLSKPSIQIAKAIHEAVLKYYE
jgi:N-acetylmuramoyl-L-alanine amidase